MEEKRRNVQITEKEITKRNGAAALLLIIVAFLADIAAFTVSLMLLDGGKKEDSGRRGKHGEDGD